MCGVTDSLGYTHGFARFCHLKMMVTFINNFLTICPTRLRFLVLLDHNSIYIVHKRKFMWIKLKTESFSFSWKLEPERSTCQLKPYNRQTFKTFYGKCLLQDSTLFLYFCLHIYVQVILTFQEYTLNHKWVFNEFFYFECFFLTYGVMSYIANILHFF